MSGPKERDPVTPQTINSHKAFAAFRELLIKIRPPSVADTSGTAGEEGLGAKTDDLRDPGTQSKPTE